MFSIVSRVDGLEGGKGEGWGSCARGWLGSGTVGIQARGTKGSGFADWWFGLGQR